MNNKKLKISIQGIAASFHDLAAKNYFGENIELLPCNSFKSACDMLSQGNADFCVMAIENSIAGSILTNYTLLKEYHFRIIGEVYLHIEMSLMALPGMKVKDLEFVQSHPVALKQCADFLDQYKYLKVVELYDTAACAREISQKNLKNTGAIAHIAAAREYGLEVLHQGIETNKKNFTRFFILSNTAPAMPDADKASVSFRVAHSKGSLVKALHVFAENGLNLTKIQSVPILGKPNEYDMHVDLEWESKENYKNALAEMINHVSSLSVLGEYKRSSIFKNEKK